MDVTSLAIRYVLLIAAGLLLEVVARKLYYTLSGRHYKTHHFSWSGYILLLLIPAIATIILVKDLGWDVVKVFVVFALLGTVLEGVLGWSYKQIEGAHLWTYHRYSIKGFTSLLSIPFWGFAGILFWLLTTAITA